MSHAYVRLPWGVEIRCPCGTLHTIPDDALDLEHRCGVCGARVDLPAAP